MYTVTMKQHVQAGSEPVCGLRRRTNGEVAELTFVHSQMRAVSVVWLQHHMDCRPLRHVAKLHYLGTGLI